MNELRAALNVSATGRHGLADLVAVAKALLPVMSLAQIHAGLLAEEAAGRIELRVETCVGGLVSQADLALCIRDGADYLTTARVR